jgi:hypothetical protein
MLVATQLNASDTLLKSFEFISMKSILFSLAKAAPYS